MTELSDIQKAAASRALQRKHADKKARRKAKSREAKAAQPKQPRPVARKKQKRMGARFQSAHADFYRSAEWKRFRYEVLKDSNGRCCLCGLGANDGVTLNVDHIKPISKRPDLRLDKSNAQVLCASCNWGKGGWDDTDWRYVTPNTFSAHLAQAD